MLGTELAGSLFCRSNWLQISLSDMGKLPYTCEFLSEFSGNKWVGQKTVLPSVKKTFEIVGDSSCKTVKL